MTASEICEARERLGLWCDAAIRYLVSHKQFVRSLSFGTVAWTTRHQKDWDKQRLRVVAAFVDEELTRFHAKQQAREAQR